MPEPFPTKLGREGFAGRNQQPKSTERAEVRRIGCPLENFAQQRRHDLEYRHLLTPDLVEQQRGILDDSVGADVDARSDHEGREELPDRDVEALGRRLGDHVRRRERERRDHVMKMIEEAALLDHGAFRSTGGARGVDDVGEMRRRRPSTRHGLVGRGAGERFEAKDFRALRHCRQCRFERRRAVLAGEHNRRVARLEIRPILAAGQPGSKGRKAPPACCTAIIPAKRCASRLASNTTTVSEPTPSRARPWAMPELSRASSS